MNVDAMAEEAIEKAQAEKQQEQLSQQYHTLGHKIRATYGDEFAESFTKLQAEHRPDEQGLLHPSQPKHRSIEMEESVMQWCKMAMEHNYFIKCRCENELRKKPFAREGFDVQQLKDWACTTFNLNPSHLTLEFRSPSGSWFALSTNEHFHAAVRSIRPAESEPFSVTVRASEQPEGAAVLSVEPDYGPAEPAPAEEQLSIEPDYDARTCTQFVLLGLDQQAAAPPAATEWENGEQCNKCIHQMGKDSAPCFG